MREQHIYSIKDDEKGIVYIFNVDRVDNKLILNSIWLVVIINDIETKIILDIPGLMREMLLTPEQAADLDTRTIIKEWFDDMKLSQGECIGMDIEEVDNSHELLEAADKAAIIPGKYDDIIRDLLNVRKS